MSRRHAKVTQADVARALRAAEQVAPGRFVIDITADGTIRIVPLDAAQISAGKAPAESKPDDPFARGLEIVP